MAMFEDVTIEELGKLTERSWRAFHQYKDLPLANRADFMRIIAEEMEAMRDELIQTAREETSLTIARLQIELTRTQFQLRSYADACEKGNWLDLRINTAHKESPDIRKMLIPLGPVAVFGAANFPFAYSTAGGDTACALAAGCSVVVKAHPGHAATSELMSGVIKKAINKANLPRDIFIHVHGASFKIGKALVEDTYIKAVGFTGSLAGGKQLFDWANQRKEPIPVFAEMSSINPVFLLPDKLKLETEKVARMLAESITLGVGQFCTNPGLIVGMEGDEFTSCVKLLGDAIRILDPGAMLNKGIFKNYVETRGNALAQEGVQLEAIPGKEPLLNEGSPTIALTDAKTFVSNPLLHKEVFGPYSLVIRCADVNEMIQVAMKMDGQLTASIMGTTEEIVNNKALIDAVQNFCGRFILNGVPTGVEVCLSMHHGGPFPATTDSRFTSVGADGIKRFARPIAYQNWNDELLPPALQNANQFTYWRTVNDNLTQSPIN